MAKVLRWNAQDVIDQATLTAEGRTFGALKGEFEGKLVARFNQVKDTIEDWQDAITNEALLQGRLQTIAAKSTYTENNLLDMALISMILSNIREEEV
jgi:hypothetical protein